MKRKFLEDLGLEKEVIDKILNEAGTDLESAKSGYETLKKEKEHLDEELKKRDSQIEDLKKNVKSVEDLTNEIDKLKKENATAKEAHEKEMFSVKVDSAVDKALTVAKAKNKMAVRALIKDLDKAQFNDDGTIKGLSEQIKNLTEAEDSKFLFEEQNATPQITGAVPATSSNGAVTGNTGTDPKTMTYSQMMAQLAANPNAKF